MQGVIHRCNDGTWLARDPCNRQVVSTIKKKGKIVPLVGTRRRKNVRNSRCHNSSAPKKNDKNQLPMESKLETAHTLKVPVHSCTCTMLSGAAQFALVKPHEPIKEHTHGDDENLESRGFQKNVATIERRAFTPSLCFSFLAFLLFARLGKGPLPWLRTS